MYFQIVKINNLNALWKKVYSQKQPWFFGLVSLILKSAWLTHTFDTVFCILRQYYLTMEGCSTKEAFLFLEPPFLAVVLLSFFPSVDFTSSACRLVTVFPTCKFLRLISPFITSSLFSGCSMALWKNNYQHVISPNTLNTLSSSWVTRIKTLIK